MPIGSDNCVYTIIQRDGGTYAVEMRRLDGIPELKEGFKTKTEADDWIFDQIQRTADEPPPFAGPPDSLPGHGPE